MNSQPLSLNSKLIAYFFFIQKNFGLQLLTYNLNNFLTPLNQFFHVPVFYNFYLPQWHVKKFAAQILGVPKTKIRQVTPLKRYLVQRKNCFFDLSPKPIPTLLVLDSTKYWFLIGRQFKQSDIVIARWRFNWERFLTARKKLFLNTVKRSLKRSLASKYITQKIPLGSFYKKPNFFLSKKKKFNLVPRYNCLKIIQKLFIRRRQRRKWTATTKANTMLSQKTAIHRAYRRLAITSKHFYLKQSSFLKKSKYHPKALLNLAKGNSLKKLKVSLYSRLKKFKAHFNPLTRLPYKTWIGRRLRAKKPNYRLVLKKQLMLKKAQTLKCRTTELTKRYFRQVHSLLYNRRLKTHRTKKIKSSIHKLATKPRPLNLDFTHSLPAQSRKLIVTRPLKKTKRRKVRQRLLIQKNLLLTRSSPYATFFININRKRTFSRIPFFCQFPANFRLWGQLLFRKKILFLPVVKYSGWLRKNKLKRRRKKLSQLKKKKRFTKTLTKAQLPRRQPTSYLYFKNQKWKSRNTSLYFPLSFKFFSFKKPNLLDLGTDTAFFNRCYKRKTWKIMTARRQIKLIHRKIYKNKKKRRLQKWYNTYPYYDVTQSKYLLKRFFFYLNWKALYFRASYKTLNQRRKLLASFKKVYFYRKLPFWRPKRNQPSWKRRRRGYISYFRTRYTKFMLQVRRRTSNGRLPRLHKIKKRLSKFRKNFFCKRAISYRIRSKQVLSFFKSPKRKILTMYYRFRPLSFAQSYPSDFDPSFKQTLFQLVNDSQPLLTFISAPRYTLESTHATNFILPLHSYLYLTPPSPLFTLRKWLTLKVQAYSFASFFDVKAFFLKKYSTTLQTLGLTTLPKKYQLNNNFWALYQRVNFRPQNSINSTLATSALNLNHNINSYAVPQVDPKIRRIRFKPGYSKIWRSARIVLKYSLNLKYFYQHQLTKYLTKFFRFSRIKLMQYYEVRLVNLLLYSKLTPDLISAKETISNNLIFINGTLCLNPNLILLKNDLFQLVISLKYYLLSKWLVLWAKKQQQRLGKFALKNHLKLNSRTSGLLSERFPRWILSTLFFKSDIPSYLEVDYFTLSGFMIYSPFRSLDFHPLTWEFNKYSIYNVYNWNYIT